MKITLKTFLVYSKESIVAYIIVNPENGRIKQFAVSKAHRNKGIGSLLFDHLSLIITKPLSILNVANCKTTDLFLRKMGFKPFLSQYEMLKEHRQYASNHAS